MSSVSQYFIFLKKSLGILGLGSVIFNLPLVYKQELNEIWGWCVVSAAVVCHPCPSGIGPLWAGELCMV